VIAVEDPTELFRVHQNEFRYTLQAQAERHEHEKLELVRGVGFLRDHLSPADVEKVGSVMTPRLFRAGDLLLKKGEECWAFYIIVRVHTLFPRAFRCGWRFLALSFSDYLSSPFVLYMR